MSSKIIQIKDVWKHYNGKEVLCGLSFDVYIGETVVILGRSGSGKSVLLRQIMGIENPDKGEVIVHDVSIFNLEENKRFHTLKGMGMLFQASALFDSLNIRENTAFYLREHGKENKTHYSEDEINEKVDEALKMVGLEKAKELMPSDLSGGMKKRAALARLIVYRPKILLYDEPTTGLDPITSIQINNLIMETQQKLQATSIVVTHDLITAFQVADRIALIHDGKILYITTKEKFGQIDDPRVQDFLKSATPNE